MDPETLRKFLESEAEKPFSGWDFSYIEDDRVVSAPLPWSYTSLLIPIVRSVISMLDMDTGGGEKLARLSPLPQFTCATEGYLPNIPIARAALEPLGVQVFECDTEAELPFAGGQFELVSNRHGAYVADEVYRILLPGGIFITQQVGQENDVDINRLLQATLPTAQEDWNLTSAVTDLKEAGFEITQAQEAFPLTRFFDVGALVYLLTAIPWQVDGFTVDAYFDRLLALHQRIQNEGYLDIKSHRFLIVAHKPD